MAAGTITIIDDAGSTTPTGFTKMGGATTEFTVRDDGTLPGGKYIECDGTTAASIALSIDAAGTIESDQELLCMVRPHTDVDVKRLGALFLRATVGVDDDYVYAFLRKLSAGVDQHLAVADRVTSVHTEIATGAFSWSTNTWYTVRLRVQGTSASGKVWQPANLLAPTGDEPSQWTAAGTTSAAPATGPIAFGLDLSPESLVDFLPLGWATGGESAPTDATQMIYAAAIVEANGWVGAVTDIDERGVPTDGDFVESPTSPTTAEPIVLRAEPAADPETNITHQVLVRAWKNTLGGAPTLTFTPVWRTGYVNSGDRGTIIKTGSPQTLTGTPTNYVLTLSEAEAGNIPSGEYTTGVFVELIPEQT